MPEVASLPLKVTVTAPSFHPSPLGNGAAVAAAGGGVASRRTVTELLAVPPPLVAVQVKPCEPSVVTVTAPQPVEALTTDSASVTLQDTATFPVYQPASPAGPATVGMMTGGVASRITSCSWTKTSVLALVSPATRLEAFELKATKRPSAEMLA